MSNNFLIFSFFLLLSTISVHGFLCPGDGLWANTDNLSLCTTFFSCTNGLGTLMNCPYPLAFHQGVGCVTPTNGDCNFDSNRCSGVTATGYSYQDYADCTKFWSCAPSGIYLMQCPTTTAFNPQGGYCDYVYNVPSCNQGLCSTNPTGSYTYFEKPIANFVCSPNQYWLGFLNPYDSSKISMIYCWGDKPIIVYCCGVSRLVTGDYNLCGIY